MRASTHSSTPRLFWDCMAANELAVAGDRAFFALKTDRHHYVRPASQAERILTLITFWPEPPRGYVWYSVIRRTATGALLRHCFASDPGFDTDAGEAAAAALWLKAEKAAAHDETLESIAERFGGVA